MLYASIIDYVVMVIKIIVIMYSSLSHNYIFVCDFAITNYHCFSLFLTLLLLVFIYILHGIGLTFATIFLVVFDFAHA